MKRISEIMLAIISVFVLFASVGMLFQSIRKRDVLISEAAWDRLTDRPHALRRIFALSFLSLIIYLFAESAGLLNLDSPSATLEGLHETGELVHMFIFSIALLLAIPLFFAMGGRENAP